MNALLNPLLTTTEIRVVEQAAMQHLPARLLMLRAARAAANLALEEFKGPYLVLAGPGNNGGDALETALLLAEAWQEVRVVLLADPQQLTHDTRMAYERCIAANIHLSTTLPPLHGFQCIIDGLLGIGATRALDHTLRVAANLVNDSGCPVLALDVPSGLNADTGRVIGGAAGLAVKAQKTITFLAGKPGLFTGQGREYAGQVEIDDLQVNLPETCLGRLNQPPSFSQVLKKRRSDSHKGEFGNVLILGGHEGMVGAALLAGRTALFAGAGRVYVHTLAGLSLDPMQAELMLFDAKNFDPSMGITVCGPGLGSSDAAHGLLDMCLYSPNAVVLDADALNMLSADVQLKKRVIERKGPTVLTPHPLEAARLLGEEPIEVNSDRLRAAQELANLYGAVVVLKGSGSIIAEPEHSGGRWAVNPTGNPGLATAGTGDVLAGLIGALLAQRHSTIYESTCAAVWLHGKAADDLVTQGIGPIGLTATELLKQIRQTLNAVTYEVDAT